MTLLQTLPHTAYSQILAYFKYNMYILSPQFNEEQKIYSNSGVSNFVFLQWATSTK